MNYKKTFLKNGLRVLTIPMASVESATATVWIKTGARFEDKKVNGISHFLEHMAFKGSKARPSAKQISEAIDSIGGEFNAGTSKEWTNFYVKARGNNLRLVFDVLSDMIINPILDEGEIEKEKGVIAEEIAMYEDTPLYRIGDIFEQLMFRGNPLGWDIIGRTKTVRGVCKDDFINYRNAHYFSQNMLLTVAGGVSQKEVVALSEKYFAELKKVRTKEVKNFKKFTFNQKKPRVLLHSKKKDQTHLILGFFGGEYGHKDRFAEAVLSSILGGGMSSRMFLEVREKRGLAYAVKTSSEHFIDTGYLSTYAGCDTKRVTQAISVMLDQYYMILDRKSQISDQELSKAKEYLKGHLSLSLEDTKDVNGFFSIEELMMGKPITPQEVFDAVDKVTKEDVYALARKYFREERLNLAIIGPFQNAERFQKILGD